MLFPFTECLAQEAEKGLEWGLEYKGDFVGNATGGLRRGSVFLGNLDATVLIDGSNIWGLEGSTIFLYGLVNHGGKPSSLVGDAQTVDNIEAESTFKLYEAWIEQVFSNARFSVLAGLFDVNAEFDSRETSSLFINSSHGIGPDFSQSGENGPSIFPVTSLGVRAKWAVSSNTYLQSALLDGVPGNPSKPVGTRILLGENDGLLSVTEFGYVQGEDYPSHRRNSEQSHDLRAAAGFWMYSAKTDPVLAGEATSNWGLYGMVDKKVYMDPDSKGGLSVFARAGIAESSVNRFGRYLSLGAVYTGPFRGREDDQVGLGLAIAINTDDYRTSLDLQGTPSTSSEKNVEFSYLARLSLRASVQFDVQYIIDPDTNPVLDNALVGIMRWTISL